MQPSAAGWNCCSLLILTLLVEIFPAASPTTIRVIQMIMGDGSANLAYNLIGPGYDIALQNAARRYPRVFSNLTVTRHYVPGLNLTCAESTGLLIEGLFRLLPESNDKSRNEFRVVLSPGCATEVQVLGDFAREADVLVLASTGSLTIPERFPTIIALTNEPLALVARAVAELLRRYRWLIVNLLCDKNPDPDQITAVEVMCAMVQSSVRAYAGQISLVTIYFDSSKPQTIKTVLAESSKRSTVNVLALYPLPAEILLTEASLSGMNTGEYVFLLPPLSAYELLEDITKGVMASGESEPLLQILPYVFQLTFTEINWDAMANDTQTMNDMSQSTYNWTVTPDHERNIVRLAAYETVQVMAEVLNGSLDRLANMSARTFASEFYSRLFLLPSQSVRTSGWGSRLVDITVKQYRNTTQSVEAVLMFDNALMLLHPANHSWNGSFSWPGLVKFPPSYLPACFTPSGERCPTDKTNQATMPAAVASVLLLFFVVCVVFRYARHGTADVTWWSLTEFQNESTLSLDVDQD